MSQFVIEALGSFGLVAVAEMGDKSQLVCISLAARHRGLPVLLGAIAAFALLNLIAVAFGTGAAQWLPVWTVAAAAAVLFAIFGVQSWLAAGNGEEDPNCGRLGRSALLGAFALIFVAEFGDKTQLAVAALAGATAALPVWLGATAALAATSALGVVAGRTVLQRLSLHWIHRLAATLFVSFAAYAAYQAVVRFPL